jgi:predicted metal-dependent hydrolase
MMELEYTIRRSPKRKTLTITVERDRSVVVHAPERMTDEALQQIVDSKKQWMLSKLRHPQKYQERLHPPGKEVVNGESAPYLGKDYRIEIGETRSGKVELSRIFTIPAAKREQRRQVLREWYIERAKETILERVKLHAKELGVTYAASRIVDSRYRWGSCTVKNSVNFNWRLIKAPMFVIDYVVIHELSHLLEPNHTERFWSIVRANSPRMERAKLWLKQQGHLLDEEL